MILRNFLYNRKSSKVCWHLVCKSCMMEDVHRTAIRKSWTTIINSIIAEQTLCIVDFLVENEILTMSMRDQIICEKLDVAKNRTLITILQRRGPQAFQLFIESLLQNNLNHVADKILSNVSGRGNTPRSMTASNNTTVSTTNSINEDTNICNICMDNRISVTLDPCGHTLCSTCGDIFLRKHECCYCKQYVTKLITIFL